MLRFRYDSALGVIRDLRGKLAEAVSESPAAVRSAGMRFVKKHPDLFGKGSRGRWKVIAESRDPQGGTGVTLQQYHGVYPVYGGSVRFHVNKDGVLDTVNNRLFPDLSKVPRKPRLTSDQAVKVAQRVTKCRSEPERKPELMVYRHEGKPRLAWEVHLNDTKPGARGVPAQWIVYVDAINGKALLYYDNIQTAGPVVGSGAGYYSGAGPVNAWNNDLTYQLRDTTRVAVGGQRLLLTTKMALLLPRIATTTGTIFLPRRAIKIRAPKLMLIDMRALWPTISKRCTDEIALMVPVPTSSPSST